MFSEEVLKRFRIPGPALWSFSGGRTSGLMLWLGIQAHGGKLPKDHHVVFANTGKERNETLDFVRDCSINWNVPITWIEHRREPGDPRLTYAEVTYETASRNGEPFTKLIQLRNFPPNPVARFCTQDLKIRPMKVYMMGLGYHHWYNIVGIRFDEPLRAARIKDPEKKKERWESLVPLFDAKITKEDVFSFWGKQPFDLRLDSYEGNCDLCFLKSRSSKIRVIKEHPELADWWIEQERETGAAFRKDAVDYKRMVILAQTPTFFDRVKEDDNLDQAIDCICGE